MKYLFIILFNSIIAFTQLNWIPEDGGNTFWKHQKSCEKESGKKCYSYNIIVDDPEIMIVKEVNGVKKLIVDPALQAAKELSLLNNTETDKAKRAIDLILKRMACNEIINSSQASQKLKNKVQSFKQAINTELQDLLNL